MKRAISLLAVVVLVTATATDAVAQFNVGGGPNVSGDENRVGFHAAAGIGVGVPVLPLGLRLEGLFQRTSESGATEDFLSGSLNATVGLPTPIIRPYLIGGGGLVRHSARIGSQSLGSDTNPAANLGAGVRVGLFGVGAYAESRYYRVRNGPDDGWSGGSSFVPITIGIYF